MKIDRDAPIGVFDSGVGGLTVAREIMRNLPSEKIVYFGDTARVPYGSKSKDTVIRYSRQIIHFLEEQQVKAIVIACNTASAFALDAVKDELDIPVLGVIEAGAKVAAKETRNKRVGVIGTLGTVGSGIHEAYLKQLDPDIFPVNGHIFFLSFQNPHLLSPVQNFLSLLFPVLLHLEVPAVHK